MCSAVCAQSVNYSLTGTLTLTSGSDPLGLNGQQVTATATLLQTTTPSNSQTTSTVSSNTYSGLNSVRFEDIGCSASQSVTMVLTDNAGAPDTVSISNCQVATATFTASVTIPDGNMITAVPAIIPSVSVTGNVSYTTVNVPTPSVFSLTQATIVATGTGSSGWQPPGVTLNPTSWMPSAPLDSTTPVSQQIAFTTSVPSAAVSFTATASGGSWLSVSTAAANTSAPITISANPTGLTQPSYSGTVTLNYGQGMTATIPVTLTMTAPQITLAAAPSMNFAYVDGTAAPQSQTLTVTSTPSTSVSAAVTSGNAWLSVSPSGSSTPAGFTVAINPAGVTGPGILNGNIQILASGATNSPLNVPVALNVSAPTLTAGPSGLTFTYQISGTAPVAQQITVGGTPGVTFTAAASTTSGGSWLTATGNGPTPGSVSVSVQPGTLKANTYSGSVTVSGGGVTQTVSVTFVVSSSPAISANPSALSFAYQVLGAAPPAQSVAVGGSSALPFTAAVATNSGGSWLAATPTSGTTPNSLSVSVNPASLTPATYTGTITISAAGATTQTVTVSLVVSPAPAIGLNPASLTFNGTIGGTAPDSQIVNATSGSPVPISVSTFGGAWLTASLSAGNTPATVTVSVSLTGLQAGTHSGSVVITSPGASNSPQVIAVQFVVAPQPVLTPAPASLGFAYVLGGANPASQSIAIGSTPALTIATSVSSASWLTVTNSSFTTPATLTVSVNPASLAANTYNAIITVTNAQAANSPLVIPVTLVVSNKPSLAASPASLTFTATVGGSNPATQSINLTAGSTLAFSTTASPGWLSISAGGSTAPATLVASVNTKGMTQGAYQGALTVTSAAAGNSPLSIPVTLNITVPLVTTPAIDTIVNAASYQTGGFAPGSIVSIFGDLLGPQTGAGFTVNSKGSLDTTLAGVTVSVNGEPAVPLFAQNGQVNVILPFTLPTSGQASIEVQYNNLTSTDFNIQLTPADVQVFTADASGSGPGSILNQDYSVNSATNPAPKGSVVLIYGTGAGLVSPAVTAGDVAGDTLSWVSPLPYSATVNGENAKVLYAGTAPSLVYGVYQFNVQLPTGLPSGTSKIVLHVGNSSSQPDVTVFVK